MAVCKWLATLLHGTTSNTAPTPPAPERREFDCVSAYEFYKTSLQKKPAGWCEWHLNIDKNKNAIKIADNFHQDFKTIKESSSIIDKIDAIEKMFLKLKLNDNDWSKIEEYLKDARQNDKPSSIVKAYTVAQRFTEYINNDSAANTYHTLKLYCTVLNCPILAQTQEYTEAITSIFFHPKLHEFLIRKEKVYRGGVLKDEKMVANYKKGVTIIITTFLSTSTNPKVAEAMCDKSGGNGISIFCTYEIKNIHRRTALNLGKLSHYPSEDEILILRYVPFTIESLDWKNDNERRMIVTFVECEDTEI